MRQDGVRGPVVDGVPVHQQGAAGVLSLNSGPGRGNTPSYGLYRIGVCGPKRVGFRSVLV